MRPIHLAYLDKVRPVLVLTRELVIPYLTKVTVAPITSAVRGLSSEVPVGAINGLETNSVISCDNILTIPLETLGRKIGYLLPYQEPLLVRAIFEAFELDENF